MDIKEKLKHRRMYLGISQQELAEMAEVGVATVKDIERGKGNPSLSTLEKLCDVLGLEIDLRLRQIQL